MPKEVFCLHGIPVDIISDQGAQFISHFWKEFCTGNLLDIKVILFLGFHPQPNGQSKRANQEVDTKLHLLCEGDPKKWSTNLPWVEHTLNSLPSSASGLSPFYTVLGFQPPLFSVQGKESQVPSAHRAAQWCQSTWRRARRSLIKTSATYVGGTTDASHRTLPTK